MSFVTRNVVRVILLNDNKELLLMCVENTKIVTVDGKSQGRFWLSIGGEIKSNESIQDAAIREIYEEAGIEKKEIELGPIVWFGECDLICNGILTRFKQKFMIAKTKQNNVFLNQLSPEEKGVVKKLEWFSLEKMQNSCEKIHPILLPKYLSNILLEKYPKKPIEIDLTK